MFELYTDGLLFNITIIEKVGELQTNRLLRENGNIYMFANFLTETLVSWGSAHVSQRENLAL